MIKTISVKACVVALMYGLTVIQIIATLHVWHSNQALHQKMRAFAEAGFVTVPNALVQPLLTTYQAAFWGGLFFTSTLGPLLFLFTVAALLIAFNLPKGKPLPVLFLGAGLMIFVNYRGLNIFATAYVTLVPMVLSTYLWRKAVGVLKTTWSQAFLFGSVGVIATVLLFISAMPENGFIRLRDRLLLSHPAGEAANDVYYRYTLFAAEVIKSNQQKQIVSYRIDAQKGTTLDLNGLKNTLAVYDYLPKDKDPVDLTLQVQANGKLMLADRYGTSLSSSFEEILSNPKKILKRFSKLSDRHSGLRQLLLAALLVGLPLLIYGVFYLAIFRVLQWWLRPGLAVISAGLLSLSVCVCFWWLMWMPGSLPGRPEALIQMMENDRGYVRLAVLEALVEQHFDITTLSVYPALLGGTDIAIRYKIAQALQFFPHPRSRQGIVSLLGDPSPNVRCMALQTLGRWGNWNDRPILHKTVQASDHWYVQHYAYRALKRLGWNQPVNAQAVLFNE